MTSENMKDALNEENNIMLVANEHFSKHAGGYMNFDDICMKSKINKNKVKKSLMRLSSKKLVILEEESKGIFGIRDDKEFKGLTQYEKDFLDSGISCGEFEEKRIN